jgi:foldase protein PrsA
MMQPRILAALCAILASAAAVAGCGGDKGVPGSAVATVDGKAIGEQSFDHWLAVAASSSGRPAAQVPKPPDYAACVDQKRKAQPAEGKATDAELKKQCGQEYQALRDQVVQLLVSFRWIEGEASERGISVDDAEVDKEFDRQRKLSFPKDADFKKFLESSGQTEEDIVTRVRLDLLSSKIREQVVKGEDKLSEQQIAAYYDKNKARFAQPQRRDLRIVLTQTKASARRAMSALARGGSWSAVAKAQSIDPDSKSQGGKLLDVIEGRQDKALDKAVFSAPTGKLVGPVKTQLGYYVFEVTKVKRPSQQTLEQAEPAIRELLASESQQKKLSDFTERFREKWKARTECRENFATPECKNGPKATPTPVQQSGAQPVAPQP